MLHLLFSLIRTELIFQDHYNSKNSTPNNGQVSPYHCLYLFEFCPPNVHLNSLTTSCAPALFQMPSAVFHRWPSSLWPQNSCEFAISLLSSLCRSFMNIVSCTGSSRDPSHMTGCSQFQLLSPGSNP